MLAELRLAELRNDTYALVWLLGITIAVTLITAWMSKAVARFLILIRQEKARQADEDQMLRRALSYSRPEDWVSGGGGEVASGCAGPVVHRDREASRARARCDFGLTSEAPSQMTISQ
ncbi:MAG: hypothetical protein ABR924_18935 [Terracidiphilus sp.]|jgi:hypothetical protein